MNQSRCNLKSGIVVLVGIVILVGAFPRINKRTGGNKWTGMVVTFTDKWKFLEASCPHFSLLCLHFYLTMYKFYLSDIYQSVISIFQHLEVNSAKLLQPNIIATTKRDGIPEKNSDFIQSYELQNTLQREIEDNLDIRKRVYLHCQRRSAAE